MLAVQALKLGGSDKSHSFGKLKFSSSQPTLMLRVGGKLQIYLRFRSVCTNFVKYYANLQTTNNL